MNRKLGGDIFIAKYDLEYLDKEISELSKPDRKVNLIDLYSSEVFVFYSMVASSMRQYSEVMTLADLGIDDYLCYIHNNSEFERLSRKFTELLQKINANQHSDFQSYTDTSNYLMKLGINKNFQVSAHMEKVAQLREMLLDLYKSEDALFWKIRASVPFVWVKITDEVVQFVIAEYRRFVKEYHNRISDRIRSSAMKFKANRQDKLSREHWAKLADMEDEVITKVIRGESINNGNYDDFFSQKDLEEFSSNKEVLKFLKKTSDDELLYNFERALYDYDMVHTINEDQVYFYFNFIHRETLIKCELFDNLRQEYDAFLNGKEAEVTNVDAGHGESLEVTPDGPINPRIDEAKLISFIRDYTEGPNKSNYFDKKSYWLSIYIVLRQNIEQLDNEPIFLPSSRPKFVEWVNEAIAPSTIPCTRGVLDSAPSYFRDEDNYPWSLSDYHKANGKQEFTYNGYSMVADYFMEHLIGRIEGFLND